MQAETREHGTRTDAAISREVWLNGLAEELNVALFNNQMPTYRVTCGWPSRRATSLKNRAIGQCFYAEASQDKTHELIVSMYLDDPMDVAATLAHEMVHAIAGAKAGHKGPFRKLALEIGLEGRMTETCAGEAFKQSVQPILDKLDVYPHAKLDASSQGKKQTTRLLKVECEECGYTARITRKWLDALGAPICPIHGQMGVAQ